jgi:hypothetical protein
MMEPSEKQSLPHAKNSDGGGKTAKSQSLGKAAKAQSLTLEAEQALYDPNASLMDLFGDLQDAALVAAIMEAYTSKAGESSAVVAIRNFSCFATTCSVCCCFSNCFPI